MYNICANDKPTDLIQTEDGKVYRQVSYIDTDGQEKSGLIQQLPMGMYRHFTHTGPNAGAPYCGVDKHNTPGIYQHPPYNSAQEALLINDPCFCPACKSIIESLGEEETPC